MEPAIVQNEALYTDLGSGICQLLQRVQIMIKIEAFPGVQVHGAWLHRATRPLDAFAYLAMERPGHAVGTFSTAGGKQIGCIYALTRIQPHLTRRKPFPKLPVPAAIIDPLDLLEMVS